MASLPTGSQPANLACDAVQDWSESTPVPRSRGVSMRREFVPDRDAMRKALEVLYRYAQERKAARRAAEAADQSATEGAPQSSIERNVSTAPAHERATNGTAPKAA